MNKVAIQTIKDHLQAKIISSEQSRQQAIEENRVQSEIDMRNDIKEIYTYLLNMIKDINTNSMQEVIKNKLKEESKTNVELSTNELLQISSALMIYFANQYKDLNYYENEYNTPKKPYSLFSFGVHLKDITGNEKKDFFKKSIDDVRQRIEETKVLIDKINNITENSIG